MTNKPSNYWEERFLQLEDAQAQRTEVYFATIAKAFKEAQSEIEKEVLLWYAKFAKRENITLAEAKRLLTSNELKTFKITLEEYIAHATDPKWEKALQRASAKVHISRLEMLQIQLAQLVHEMFSEYEETIEDFLVDSYTTNYYHTAHQIAVGTGEGVMLSTLAKEEVRKIVSKPWAVDERNFSERIWNDKLKLINDLHVIMSRGFAIGADQWTLTEELVKRTNASYSNASRLIATESSFVRSASTVESYKDTDVEQYKYLATLDHRTSQTCRRLDGKIFEVKDYKVGVNAPPMHPRCRSTTTPHFGFVSGTRRARDENGKNIYVPADMTYEQWFDKFVKK